MASLILRRAILFLSLIYSFQLFAQNTGKILEDKILRSEIRTKDVRYSVYLPADYQTSERSYPVVYLLHGYTDDNTAWLQFDEINRYADQAIHDGTIPPMIIVMPDADSTFYINSYDGKDKYEDFFVKEFIPFIEKTYRTKPSKNYRAVAGLSMGGYGSLIYGLKYPHMFSAIAPLSAAVLDDESLMSFPADDWDHVFAPLFGAGLSRKARLTKTWYENSILKLVESKSVEELRKVQYWIDCGDDDFLVKGNCLLHIALKEKKIAHEFRVRDGEHNWDYWRTGIVDALRFIGKSFHQ